MEGNIFYVATLNDAKFGMIAYSGKIHASNNLVGVVNNYITFNICKTKKEADKIAKIWNDDFKKNGKQFL